MKSTQAQLLQARTESRPLSYMEKFATGWGTQNIHFTFSGPFTETLIASAMQQVRISNPLLRCVIRDSHIVTMSSADIQAQELPIVCRQTSGGSKQRYELAAQNAWEGMALNMVPEKLWEALFFYDSSGCEMVLRTHHSILDGMSWFSVIADFLNACEGNSLEIKPLNPPMESVYEAHAKAIAGQEPFALQAWLDTKGTDYQTQPIFTQTVLTRLSKNLLNELKVRCGERGVTVHGALMAAYLLATDNALPKLYSDISTRRFCEPRLSPTYPGIYIGQVVWETSALKSEGFWESAARLLRELRERIEAGVHLSSNEECSSTSVGPEILNITNMAPPDFPNGKFSLEYASLYFAMGNSPEVPSFPVIFSIITINGICNLQFNYHQNFWTRSQAQNILSKLVDILAVEGAGLTVEEVERTHDFQPLKS